VIGTGICAVCTLRMFLGLLLLEMEAPSSTETSVSIYQPANCHHHRTLGPSVCTLCMLWINVLPPTWALKGSNFLKMCGTVYKIKRRRNFIRHFNHACIQLMCSTLRLAVIFCHLILLIYAHTHTRMWDFILYIPCTVHTVHTVHCR
jgi:hypothetical protein